MNTQKHLVVKDFSTVEKHYTKEEFLDIMIDIMENTVIPKNLNFDMAVFAESGFGYLKELDDYSSFEEYQDDLHKCDTSCCMLGWAASDKRLTDKGLFLDNTFELCVLNDNIEENIYISSDELHEITGMYEDEIYMLFGGCVGERAEGLYQVIGAKDTPFGYAEFDMLTKKYKHFDTEYEKESTPEDALAALKWYRKYISNN